MKAVILAGGSSARLQPICGTGPKCMAPVLGKPLLEHLLMLLRSHGITQVCIAMGANGQQMQSRLSDGRRLGMQLVWAQEQVPLGTAGCVTVCRQWLGDEDALILCADMLTDMDLTGAAAFHREKKALATVLIQPHPRPTEYSLVLTDGAGRVTSFVDRPTWGQTLGDTVSTGVYILSPEAVEQLSAGQDFERDVFPDMIRRKQALYAVAPAGAWYDMGDCAAYLDGMEALLSGKVKADMGMEQVSSGIWSAGPVPDNVTLIPPCWLGQGIQLGSGSLIGPHVVMEQGSRTGARSLVQRSVLHGASAGDRVTLYGAVLCAGAQVDSEAVVNDGAVLGENTLVGSGAVIMERVRLWSGQSVSPGSRVRHSPARKGRPEPLRFGDGGVIRGILGETVSAESLLALGGILAGEGRVGLGCSEGAGAKMLLRSVVSGVTAAGGCALCHEMECAAQAAWLAEHCQLPISLFIEQDADHIFLHLFDSGGLPLVRARQRKLEYALTSGQSPVCSASRVGSCDRISCTPRDYFRDGARRCALRRMGRRSLTVAVEGTTAADRALRGMLEEMGCTVTDRWQQGIPAFRSSHGGFLLTARDERGAVLTGQQLLAMAALVELEHGGGRLAVPDDASAAVELVAAGFGKSVQRLGRDGEQARRLYRSLPWLRDAAFAAARLCARMTAVGERLEQLAAKTPRFVSWRREVPVTRNRAELMARLRAELGADSRIGEGLRLRDRGGWVYVVPLSRRPAVQVVAESDDLELAAELCDFYADGLAKMDREQQTK